MRKKILYKTLIFLILLILFSCRTEEIMTADFSNSIPIQGKEYNNKSLWKEDEVFIKNVKKIFDENDDENRMQSRYGTIFWDYATSMNTYDETLSDCTNFKRKQSNFLC